MRVPNIDLTKRSTPSNDTLNDPVNHPSHYTQGAIECIDAIQASMSSEEFKGFLKGNCIKYLWRAGLKDNPVEDIQKAGWYRDRLEKFLNQEHK